MGRFNEAIQGEKTMTLFRQIALLITAIFTILFIIGLSVSFTIIQQTAKKSLYENAQNSATSISLSINSLGSNLGAVQTVVNASFDNGNYEKIIFRNMDNEIKYSRQKAQEQSLVPDWFESLIVRMDSISAKANISKGWNIIGVVEVYSDLEVVYVQLYEIFQTLLYYLALCFVIALSAIYLFFHILLKPLSHIQKQAQAIMNNEFIVCEKLPKTYEFNSVTKSMNAMVKKVEQIFQSANDALKQNKELLYIDSSTKLHNRRYFALKASEYILENSSFSRGILLSVGISRVDLLNKLVGYKNTDDFLNIIAIQMRNHFEGYAGSLLVRLNGTEFVVMIPSEDVALLQEEIKYFSSILKENFKKLKKDEERIELSVGVATYQNEKNLAQLFAKIDNSLAHAKLSNESHVIQNNVPAMGKEQWRELLIKAIENDSIEVQYSDIVNSINSKVLYHDVHIYLKDNNNTYAYSEFIAAVIELGMLSTVYMSIIKKLLNQSSMNTPTLMHLPFHLIECTQSYQNLKEILEFSKEHKKNIIFEISEDALNKRYDCSVHIIELIKNNGYDFALSSFIANSDDYQFLKELKPKYIKMSKAFILDSSQNIGLVKIIMESVGLEIVATDVQNSGEIERLKALGIESIKKSES
jgi:diguanylate cyclase (GGDEF)-like protein